MTLTIRVFLDREKKDRTFGRDVRGLLEKSFTDEKVEPIYAVYLTLDQLKEVLTPEKLSILKEIRKGKKVDLQVVEPLLKLGLVEKEGDRYLVPYNKIKVEFPEEITLEED